MSDRDDFFWEKQDIDWKEIFQNLENKGEKIKVSDLAEYLESNLDQELFKSQYIHIIARYIETGILEIDEKQKDIRENTISIPSHMIEEKPDRKNKKQADFSEF